MHTRAKLVKWSVRVFSQSRGRRAHGVAPWRSGRPRGTGGTRLRLAGGAYRRPIEDRGDMTGTQTAAVAAGPAPGYGEVRRALLAAAVHVVATRRLRRLTYRSVAQEA